MAKIVSVLVSIQFAGSQIPAAKDVLTDTAIEDVTKTAKNLRAKICRERFGDKKSPSRLLAYKVIDSVTRKVMDKSDNWTN